MPKQTFSTKFSKNTGRVISPSELKQFYFFGIPIEDQNGNKMPNESIEFYIKSAQQEIENYLDIKIIKQVVQEDFHFSRSNYWWQWSYIRTTRPVVKALKLQGFLNDVKQVDFPDVWLSSKSASDGISYQRRVNLVPSYRQGGQITSNELIYTGLTVNGGLLSSHSNIPDYWSVKYVTGFDIIPEDILDVIGKWAAIKVFHQLGDIIIGAGIATQSLSIDSLSQSIGTTSSATNAGYGARITNYINEIKDQLKRLERTHKGFSFASA